MCVHETVVQRALCNFTTFRYHWKIYRFQFPFFATSIYNGYIIIFAPRYFRFYLWVCLVLNSPKQYCGKIKIIGDIENRKVLIRLLTKRAKIKRGQIVPLNSVHSTCISVSVSDHSWPCFWLLLLSLSLAVSYLAFSYVYWSASETGDIDHLWLLDAVLRWNAWSDASRTTSSAQVKSFENLEFHAILSHYLTTLAFIL